MPPHSLSLLQTFAASTGGNVASPTPRPADVDMGSPRNTIRASFTMSHFGRPANSCPIEPEVSTSSSKSTGMRSRLMGLFGATFSGRATVCGGAGAAPAGIGEARRNRRFLRRPGCCPQTATGVAASTAPPGDITLGLLQPAPQRVTTSAASTADGNSAVRFIARFS